MAVLAQAQTSQVEGRDVRRKHHEAVSDQGLVPPRRKIQIGGFAAHPVGARGHEAERLEEGSMEEAVVGIGILRRNGTLVREVAFDGIPVDAAPRRLLGEQPIQGLRRRSSGEEDAAGLVRPLPRHAVDEILDPLARHIFRPVHDANSRLRRHQRPHDWIKDSAARDASSSGRFGAWRWISPTMQAANPR